MRVSLILAIVLFGSLSFAQPPDTLWTRYCNWSGFDDRGDYAWTIADVPGDGFDVFGAFAIDTSYAYMARFDANGDTTWVRRMSPGYVRHVKICGDGGYIAAGYPSIMRLTASGDTLWTRDGFGIGHTALELSDGGFILLCGFDELFIQFKLVRFDHFGTMQWEYAFPGWETERIALGGVVETDNGEFLVVYVRDRSPGPDSTYVTRFSSAGDSLSTVNCGNAVAVSPTNVIPATDGSFVFAEGRLLLRIDSEGNVLEQHENELFGDAKSLASTTDGGYLVSYGYAASRRLLRLDAEFDSLWNSTLNLPIGLSQLTIVDAQAADDGGFFFCGLAAEEQLDSARMFVGRLDHERPFVMRTVTAIPDETSIELQVVSAWEFESATLELWRATEPDGTFELVASTQCAGSASDGASYVFSDNDVLPNQAYWYYPVVTNTSGRSWDYRSYMVSSALNSADNENRIPSEFSLSVYPNPFNASTTISFTLPVTTAITLSVYDVNGRSVNEFGESVYAAGEHHLSFDGSKLPSGLYFATLTSSVSKSTQKLLLLK